MMMRPLLLFVLLSMTPLILRAQTAEPPAPRQPIDENGLGLIERGMGMILDRLITDLGPDLNQLGQDMSDTVTRIAPVFEDLSVLMDDLANYQTPERLENGDILIRRKPGAPPAPPIGDSLRDFTIPRPDIPVDPNAPEITL